MSELIQTLVSVKDPFTLFAFVVIALLIAFKTKSVPESMFKLVNAKITRQRFYQLLNRSIAYAFAIFLVLCAIAILGQVLDYKTTAKAASLDELKVELEASQADRVAAQKAMELYQKSIALAQNEKLGDAIASLEASLKTVPTATARETLALLYQQIGDRPRALELAEDAVNASREKGTAVERAKADRLLATVRNAPPPATKPCPRDAGLVGAKLDLPAGGEDFENATPLEPCVYKGLVDVGTAWRFYKVSVPKGRTLRVIMRTRSVDAGSTDVRLHGPNGGSRGGYSAYGESSLTSPLEFKAEETGAAYVAVKGGVRGSAFEIALR
jgi:hypothetical protein